jgi:hypothetical protein
MTEQKLLTAEDLVIGGKYVPHQKTDGDSLDDSHVWEKAQEQNQPFLYYIGFYEHPDSEIEKKVHLFCNEMSEQPDGDFFNPEDVTPYIEPIEDVNDTLEAAAKEYAMKMWGGYFNDKYLDIAIDNTVGEISIKDFFAGANWQKEQVSK